MDNFLYLPRALASILFDIPFATAFGSLFALLWLRHLPVEASVLGPMTKSSAPEGTSARERSVEAWGFSPMNTTLARERASAPDLHLQSDLRRTLGASAALMLLALPIQLWLLTATMLASSSPADIRPQLYDVLTSTHAGRILIPQTLCAFLLLLCAPFIAPLSHAMSGFRTNPRLYLSLTLVFALAAFRSASGHAAANGNMSLSEAVQFLHLTSIAIWSGGIIISGWLVLPRLLPLDQLTAFGRRLSTTATVAIVAVALSGVYNAWLGLDGSLKPLPHTQWGLILMAKSALVLAALGVGARNRFLLGRNPILTAADAAGFRRSMRFEAAIMGAILVFSGFLANSPPATGQ